VKKTFAVLSLVGALLMCSSKAVAQSGNANQTQSAAPAQSGIDRDIQMLRQDLRSKKKQTIAANLQLTEAQSTNFWPVYDQYVAELTKINDEKYAVIKEYADAWGKRKWRNCGSSMYRFSARSCPARPWRRSSKSSAACRLWLICSCRRNCRWCRRSRSIFCSTPNQIVARICPCLGSFPFLLCAQLIRSRRGVGVPRPDLLAESTRFAGEAALNRTNHESQNDRFVRSCAGGFASSRP
jgi:hypothetical protein